MSTPATKRKAKGKSARAAARELPSRLCYMRSVNTGVGYFYSAPDMDSTELSPVACREAEVSRGYARALNDPDSSSDPETLRARSALFSADAARLPRDHDALAIRFSMNVFRNAFTPADCTDFAMVEALERFAQAYAKSGAAAELARRYAFNLANGTWLWRNRQGFGHRIRIVWDGGSATATPRADAKRLEDIDDNGELGAFAERLALALTDPAAPLRATVESRSLIGGGQEVFPSQLHVDNAQRSRYLSHEVLPDGTPQVIFNGRKIANALHRIDDWYAPGADVPALTVEPFAPDRRRQQAMRVVNRNDFYTLIAESLDTLAETCRLVGDPADVPDDAHFVMACLVRGGSFSGKSKKS